MTKKTTEDRQIRELLNKNLEQAPLDDLFVKKMLNRLPNKRKHATSIFEIIGYVIALTAILLFNALKGYSIINSGVVTINDIVLLVSLNAMIFPILGSILRPYFKL